MIVSHKHKFIFIKTLKTAGTSIEAFLASYCEGRDIVSLLDPEDEIVRRRIGVYPMNIVRPQFNIPDEKDADLQSAADILKYRESHQYQMFSPNFEMRRIYFGPHASAKEVRMKMGSICFNEYYVFSFDRDPWERTISFFYFTPENRKIEYATDEQVRNYITKGSETGNYFCNSRIYTSDDGKVLVDDLFNYADLDGAMQKVCNRFGFDFDKFKSLPKFKGDHRKDRRPYEEFLSAETIGMIGDINKRAVKALGFTPKAPKA